MYASFFENDGREEKEDDSKENSKQISKITILGNGKDNSNFTNNSFGKYYQYLKKRPPPINMAKIIKE